MIELEIYSVSDPPGLYAMKKFNCPACNTEHVYHCDSAKYCENSRCGVLIPEINSLLEMRVSRISWHFDRERL